MANSAYINSTDDYLRFNSHLPTFSGSPAWTIFQWVKPDSNTVSGQSKIFTTYDGSNNQYVFCRFYSATPNEIRASADNGATTATISPVSDISAQWICVALTISGSTATLYARAEGAGSWTKTTSTATTTWTPVALIGCGGLGSESIVSKRRYLRIWDAALSEAELSSEFASATVVKTANLNRSCPLAAASTVADDISSNNWDAETVGGTWGDSATEPTFATKKLKLLAHSSAASASNIAGVVFSAPTGTDITGTTRYGEFTGKTFESTLESGKAVLKVPVADFGGTALTTASTPVALVRNTTNTTGIISCTVIEE